MMYAVLKWLNSSRWSHVEGVYVYILVVV